MIKKGMKNVIILIICVCMFLASTFSPLAASNSVYMMNETYRVTTSLNKSGSTAPGSVSAVHVKGQVVSDPITEISISAFSDTEGKVLCGFAYTTGSLSCSASAYSSGGQAINMASVNSWFCGAGVTYFEVH